jgi:uncharacterized protein YjbJ (UPF0337 family)
MSNSNEDRIDGAGDKVSGNVKEGIGKLTKDEQTETEGKGDQAKGDVKQGIADIKDKVGDAVKKVTN